MEALKIVKQENKELVFKPIIVDKIRIHPFYDATALARFWPLASTGLEKIQVRSMDDFDLDKIFNECWAKPPKLLMWGIFNDGEYNGFVTTRFIYDLDGNKDMQLVHGYLKVGADNNILNIALDLLKKHGKKCRCRKIIFWSLREGWERVLSKKGWKKGYTEYYIDLKRGKEHA